MIRDLKQGDPTGAVDAHGEPLRVGDEVTFANGGVVWTVTNGYAARVDLSGKKRCRYYVKPYLLHKVQPENEES